MSAPYIAFLDLGKKGDYTVPGVLTVSRRRIPTRASESPRFEPVYAVSHLERWRGVGYPEQVRRVVQLLRRHPLYGNVEELVIDATGVGVAVADMFREADLPPGVRVVPVTITGGISVTQGGGTVHVPKALLVSVVHRLLSERRLLIPKQLDRGGTDPNQQLATIAEKELKGFNWRVNEKTAHVSYEAGREGKHDDIVLALALGGWRAESIWGRRPSDGGGSIVVPRESPYGAGG